ncbi:MAG: transposase [Gammaproteobacteria bacterium]|nr:transposase [Gammaproteobacteria bacterium]
MRGELVPLHHASRHHQRTACTQPGRLKTPYREGTTHIVMSPLEFLQRLAALVPRPRLHLIRFHGVLAPEARPREKPAWRAEDAARGCVPRSFRACRSTPIPPQPTTPRRPLPRRLPA